MPTNTQENQILTTILDELRLLRGEISMLFPQEEISEYANPKRLMESYRKALKEYPPQTSA